MGITLCDNTEVYCCLEGINIHLWRCFVVRYCVLGLFLSCRRAVKTPVIFAVCDRAAGCSRAAPAAPAEPAAPRTKPRGRVDLPHALLSKNWLFFCLNAKGYVGENILYLPLGIGTAPSVPETPLNQVQVHETCWAAARSINVWILGTLQATWTLASINWRISWRKSGTSHSEIFAIKCSTLTRQSMQRICKIDKSEHHILWSVFLSARAVLWRCAWQAWDWNAAQIVYFVWWMLTGNSIYELQLWKR